MQPDRDLQQPQLARAFIVNAQAPVDPVMAGRMEGHVSGAETAWNAATSAANCSWEEIRCGVATTVSDLLGIAVEDKAPLLEVTSVLFHRLASNIHVLHTWGCALGAAQQNHLSYYLSCVLLIKD